MKPLLTSFTLDELRAFFVDHGLPHYSAGQIFSWIYKKGRIDIESWSDVSKKAKALVLEELDISLPEVAVAHSSEDGTRKFLLRLRDGETIEAVAIPSRERLTLCLSSQVGCAIGCRFCHTSTQGFTRHLEAGEIVGQYLAVTQWLNSTISPEIRFTNLVYMGQGEPLHNFENVKTATLIFMEDGGCGFGQRRITLSTSGLVPQIEKLIDFPPINVSISLHSACNETRTRLMPINKTYDIDRLFKAIASIPLKAYRRITYEYLLIDGINNGVDDLDALAKRIDRQTSKINLIVFNEFPGCDFKRPSDENVKWFMEELANRGFTATVRQSKGRDILAACGQLKSQVEKKQN